MSFVKWDSNRTPAKQSLRLNATNLHVGSAVYEAMGKPERIEIYYDTDKNAIKIEPSEHGRKIATDKGRAPHVSIKLARVMPKGRYDMAELGVFELATPATEQKEGRG